MNDEDDHMTITVKGENEETKKENEKENERISMNAECKSAFAN